MAVVFILLLIGFVGYAIMAQRVGSDLDRDWSLAAEQLGISFHPSTMFRGPRIEGNYGYYLISVFTGTDRSRQRSHPYTVYRVEFPEPLDQGLRLTRQSLFDGMAVFLGAEDIEVGDEVFDDSVRVRGDDPRRLRRFLTPERRSRVRTFLEQYERAQIDDVRVSCKPNGHADSSEEMVTTLVDMLRLAEALAGERLQDPRFLKLLERRAGIERSAPILLGEALVRQIEQDSREAQLQGQAAGPSEPTPVVEVPVPPAPPPVSAPPPEEVVVKSPPDADDPPAANEPKAPDTEVAPPNLSASHVCAALFAAEASAFDTEELFERQFKGRRVRWQGKLRTLERSSYEYAFGSQPVAKAVVEIVGLESQGTHPAPAVAVVQLTEAEVVQLGEGRGVAVEFEGELLSFDRLMKKLFLRTGRLTVTT